MRDPARIPRILALLEAYWTANPDLRLGQIASNLAPADPFHYEDSELEEALSRELKQLEPAAPPVGEIGERTRPSWLAE